MLINSESSDATDLWALGCILFQMLTGRVPFQGQGEYETLNRITKRDFEMPESLSGDAQIVIDKLLSLEPAERSNAEYYLSHPFFADVEFKALFSKNLSSQVLPLLSPFLDNSDKLTLPSLKKSKDSWVDLGEAQDSLHTIVKSGELKKLNEYGQNQVRTFVLFGDGHIDYFKDKIMYRGSLKLTKDSQVIVTDQTPRKSSKSESLQLPRMTKLEAPGTIVSQNGSGSARNLKYLQIQTPNRTYYLSGISVPGESSSHSVALWAEKLNNVILAINN